MPKLHKSWERHIGEEFNKSYFAELARFVDSEYKNCIVYPPNKNVFRAFDLCPFDDVRVVILGQDPYHGVGQANGLCFAVGENVALPPSLKNIFKEIESDIGAQVQNSSGDLSRWASQGVLLLNSTLTVRADSAGSHQKKGWENFTDSVVRALSVERKNIVFLLWGNYAKAKGAQIDRKKHLVLEAPHPSPFSAYTGFLGCKHFSLANKYLRMHNKNQIEWI